MKHEPTTDGRALCDATQTVSIPVTARHLVANVMSKKSTGKPGGEGTIAGHILLIKRRCRECGLVIDGIVV